MFRFLALLILLSPGMANAQKFVTVGEEYTDPAIEPPSETVADASSEPQEFVSAADLESRGPDVVFDGASVAEINALLANAEANAAVADSHNAIVARVTTDSDGASILTLDVSNADSGGSVAAGAEAEAVALELGECNVGTVWVSSDLNCFNAYPSQMN